MLDALKLLKRCRDETETDLAHTYHTEALEIGFWSKKDIVQYVVACLHARNSMITIASFRQFLDRFTEADKNIMQQFINATPVHYWTYLPQKSSCAKAQNT